MKRPVGVTIIAVIAIIAGVLNLLYSLPSLGITLIAVPSILGTVPRSGFVRGHG
jgi:hypothetical protein